MGSILLTQEGLETSTIEEKSRNESLLNFYMMFDEALKAGDSFYMTEDSLQHKYSYGDYFPAFVHLSWDEFKKIESLRGVEERVYQYITNNFRFISAPKSIKDEEEFELQDKPQGQGGIEHSDSTSDFLCNVPRWGEWHCKYLTEHPDRIPWKENSPFIPNVEVVYKILKEEVLNYIKREYDEQISKARAPESEIDRIWSEVYNDKIDRSKKGAIPMKGNAITLFFHCVVLPSKSKAEMIAYCKQIGKKVCTANYYKYEPKLSSCEEKACGSLRKIYSIVKAGKKQYISLDFHKGMFEFHDDQGIHLGEYLFDGTKNKDAEESHNLITLDKKHR